jgi:hypothetical protein
MIKAILNKEWIKTRWIAIAIAILGLLILVYLLLRMGRSFRIAGHEHIWDVMVNRNQFMFYHLMYFPLVVGVLLGLAQYIPEILQKRLKLTLHLPMPQNSIIGWMVAYGLVSLLLFFLVHMSVLLIGIRYFFAYEFVVMAVYTVLPWYIAGILAYLACTLVCIEPTWKKRIPLILLLTALLKVFFLSRFPGAYMQSLWMLILMPVFGVLWVFWSVYRFRLGEQD